MKVIEKDLATGRQALLPVLRHPHRPHIFLAAGLAVVISLLVTSYMQATLGRDALFELQLLHARTALLDRYLQVIGDAESGVRGYQLSGDAFFLKPYSSARQEVEELHQALRISIGRHGEPRQQLEALLKTGGEKMAILGMHVINRQQDQPLDLLLLKRGHEKMSLFREEVIEFKQNLAETSKSTISASLGGLELTKWITVLLAMAAMVLLVVLFAVSQRQQALRDQIASILHNENEMLDREVRARTEELTQVATYLTNVREAEKASLARELHDELGALLTAAKMDAAWIERKLSKQGVPDIAERLARLQATLASGITLKRRITNDLRPALLFDLGLVASLRILAEEFSRTDGIPVEVDFPEGDLALTDHQSLALFRIVQEALTNIRKYAQARRVELSLRVLDGRVHVRVADDGEGFDKNKVSHTRHGLAGMQHRVQMLSGRLNIDSAPGEGTRVEVDIPLANQTGPHDGAA